MSPQLKVDPDRRYDVGEYVDVTNAAQILRVSASFLNKARLSGDGPAFAKFGKSVRYEVAGLRNWATAQMRRSTSDTREVA